MASAALCMLLVLATASVAVGEVIPQITCGSTIKFRNHITNHYVYSQEVSYGQGSGQQSVTGHPDGLDSHAYWSIAGPLSEPCTPGKPIVKGQKIRLQHMNTRTWLHSHRFASPLSGQQEVSAFGNDSASDMGDEWTVDFDGSKKEWTRDVTFRLKHVQTSAWLASHNKQYQRPIQGQTEIYATARKTSNSNFFVSEGVFFDEARDDMHDEL